MSNADAIGVGWTTTFCAHFQHRDQEPCNCCHGKNWDDFPLAGGSSNRQPMAPLTYRGEAMRGLKAGPCEIAEASMPANRLRRSLTTTIVVPAILMALAAIALLWQLNRQAFENDWVEHTDRA